MIKPISKHLEEAKQVRYKLHYLSQFIHENILNQRAHHKDAHLAIGQHLLFSIELLESDKIISSPEQYQARTLAKLLVQRRKLLSVISNHLTLCSKWAYDIHTERK